VQHLYWFETALKTLFRRYKRRLRDKEDVPFWPP